MCSYRMACDGPAVVGVVCSGKECSLVQYTRQGHQGGQKMPSNYKGVVGSDSWPAWNYMDKERDCFAF